MSDPLRLDRRAAAVAMARLLREMPAAIAGVAGIVLASLMVGIGLWAVAQAAIEGWLWLAR